MPLDGAAVPAGTHGAGAADTRRRVLAPSPPADDPGAMTTAYAYGTAHAVVMVGSVGSADGLQPRRIGPLHATIGRVHGRSRKSLCGAYVAVDEQTPWPPQGYGDEQLCAECAELATL